MSTITDAIRDVLNSSARLAVDSATPSDDHNLYQQGLTSHAVVNFLMGIEDKFDIQFPPRAQFGRVGQFVARGGGVQRGDGRERRCCLRRSARASLFGALAPRMISPHDFPRPGRRD